MKEYRCYHVEICLTPKWDADRVQYVTPQGITTTDRRQAYRGFRKQAMQLAAPYRYAYAVRVVAE